MPARPASATHGRESDDSPIEVIMAPAKPSRTSIGYSAQPSRTSIELLRWQGSNLRLAINSRVSYRSTTPERRRKERESNPQGRGPPVFETGYRASWQSFQQVTPAGLEPARRRLRVGRSTHFELRSQRCGRQGSNLQRPAFQAGALPVLSYDHADGRSWNRTSLLLRIREVLGLLSYPPLTSSPPMPASPASATQAGIDTG
jgi:hypothetical protein